MRGGPAGRYAAAAVLLALLTGCGTGEGEGLRPVPKGGDRTGPVAVAEVFLDVQYYGACGNEVLEHDGLVLYPLLMEEREALDESRYRASLDAARGGGNGERGVVVGVSLDAAALPPLPAVPAPGPGDDVGTLTVFVDGIAYFVSDSGDLESWLTDEPRSYDFVC